MDTTKIKTFAIESRRKMIESVKYQASLIGIDSEGISEPISKAEGMETYDYGAGTHSIYDEDIKKRQKLIDEIHNKGFDNVIEEITYTWFNRIIAIRYMEVNDYLPTRTRVLSSETDGKLEPDMISEPRELDFDFSPEDYELISKFKDENKSDELFQFLFIKQCNKLNEILPGLFETTNDYYELLLNISFTDDDGIIRQLIDTIPEEDFKNQVEIIGWLYQYYNSELKDETFANLKKKIKIGRKQIPSATQIFTPDWIVKYMVENSLGRLWIWGHMNTSLKSNWMYYIDDSQQEDLVDTNFIKIKEESSKLLPEDIKIIDPSMGSGHVLVYVFDILMQIYVSEGYLEKEAAISILVNNLYGLDIDDRAYQLSYFAVMMKARQYNRKIFNQDITPHLYSIKESKLISDDTIQMLINEDESIQTDLNYLIKKFEDGKLMGSIVKVEKPIDIDNINRAINNLLKKQHMTLGNVDTREINILSNIIKQYELLSYKYDVVVTNPPYMGLRSMDKSLSHILKEYYPSTKSDLSTVFMERSFSLAKPTGFISMINIPVWMFISSYEELREYMLNNSTIINLIDLGRGIFGSDFGTVTFTLNNSYIDSYKGVYRRLYEKKVSVDSVEQKEKWFFDKDYNNYKLNQEKFKQIPGVPIAYWVTDNIINGFENGKDITRYIDTFQGIITGDNKKFLRHWHELSSERLAFDKESMDDIDLNETYWIPYNKGGKFQKWYGNQDYVVNWKNGPSDKTRGKASFSDYYLKEYVSWSYIAFNTLATRYYPNGFLWDVSGSGIFDKSDNLRYLQALLGSKVGILFLKIINSTVNFQVENILQVPIFVDNDYKKEIDMLVEENIAMAKQDWDSFEISWNFNKHPFLSFKDKTIRDSFNKWEIHQKEYFDKIKYNETLINKIFIDIYELNDELNPEVTDKDITIYKPILENDVKSFISYAVGCMFGRYSLDNEGLQFAGGQFDISNYHKFIPDDDNIIPVLDTQYFEDDIVERFVEFIKVCFGEDTLEENLDFIANALSNSNKSSREKIREYLLKYFFKDHSKLYKKCPIYWMFSSGKQNGFNCLVYMHRYSPDLVARIRTDYLHKTQKAIEQNLAHCENIIANSSNKSEISKATKDKSKYVKQLDEIKVYDEALRHIANQHIEIDLDDGVNVNYAKFQNIEISKEGEKTKKINLLKKI